jgi:hypothetical protein
LVAHFGVLSKGDDLFIFFPVPGFLSGANSVFDPADALGPNNFQPCDSDPDSLMALADWRAVAGDLKVAAGVALNGKSAEGSKTNPDNQE